MSIHFKTKKNRMLNAMLQAQVSAFTKENGKICDDNLDNFLKIIGDTYNKYEKNGMDAGEEDYLTPYVPHIVKSLQKMHEALYAVDMVQYKLLFITPACEAVYGYTAEEFFANPNLWLDVVLEEDRHLIFANTPAMERGESILHSYRIKHKNGEIRWLESRIEPTLNAEGKLVRIDGITLDITKQKEADLQIEQNEKKFRSLIENSSDAITVANEELIFTFASQSLFRMTGYATEEMVGQPISGFFPEEDVPVVQAVAEEVFAKPNVPIPVTVKFVKKDGSKIWVEGFVTNLLHDPAVNGIITNFRDVTERINYERELQQSNESLKKSNNELDRFVYSVSHDLRAPLSSVLGAIELISSETSDSDILEYLKMMKKSVQKLDVFILDILDYSRNSRMEVKKSEIDFEELLADLKNNLKFATAGNDKVEIKYHVSGDMPFYSDKSRLSIVLNNLISNGIRYCNPKAEKPYVAVNVELNNDHAVISVKDNGMGIDAKFHDKIFDMFYRVSKKSNGSGLGLYIVKEALDKMNGTVDITSEVEKGTEFRLCIPNLINE